MISAPRFCRSLALQSSSLARHRRIHTGNRPYKCKVGNCDKRCVPVMSGGQQLLTRASFCRKTTLKKHVIRSHIQRPSGDFSGNELDEELEEDESPSPVVQAQEMLQYDRSHWNLPPQAQPQLMSFHGPLLPNAATYGGQHIKRETSMHSAQSFTSAPSCAASDSSYINYPHPENITSGQIQNLSNAHMRTHTPMMSLVTSHGSFHNGRPTTTIQTNMDMMNTFSPVDQVMAQPLQASPSTMSAVSSRPDNSPSRDYPQEYTSSPAVYHSQSAYAVPQSQMTYPQVQSMPHQQPYSMDSNLPMQVQATQQQAQPQQFAYQTTQSVQEVHYQQLQKEQHQREQQLRDIQRMHEVHQQQAQQPVGPQISQYSQNDEYNDGTYQEPALVDVVQATGMPGNYYGGLWLDFKKLEDGDVQMPEDRIPGWTQ